MSKNGKFVEIDAVPESSNSGEYVLEDGAQVEPK